MQQNITAFFKKQVKPSSVAAVATPLSSVHGSSSEGVSDVVAADPVCSPKLASVAGEGTLDVVSDVESRDKVALTTAKVGSTSDVSVAAPTDLSRSVTSESVHTSTFSDDFEDESPICRKRSLMYDSGFVPNKVTCTEITEDFIKSHIDIIDNIITEGRSPVVSKVDSRGSSISACSLETEFAPVDGPAASHGERPVAATDVSLESCDIGANGDYGDVSELMFVGAAKSASVIDSSKIALTVGSEPFHPSLRSGDCVTDEERKLYLNCPASQKSRCFRAYVEHYYRYNDTFVFPPWCRVRDIRDRNGLRPTDDAYDPSSIWVPPRNHPWAVEFRSCHFTECMQQWWYLKQDRFDQLLFFKMGRFYELFYHDACIVQEICGLRWMGSEAKPHVGFPEKSLHIYASSCVSRGYKVVVVEQTETPQQLEKRNRESGSRQNAVSRAICEIITPGTITRPEMLGSSSKQLLLITRSCAVEQGVNLDSSDVTAKIGFKRYDLPQFAGSHREHLLSICSMDASIGSLSLGCVDIGMGLGELRAVISSIGPAEIVVDSVIMGSLDELYGMTGILHFELTSFNISDEFTPENVGNKDAQMAPVDYSDFMKRVSTTVGSQLGAYDRLLLLLQRYLRSVMLDNLLNYCTVSVLGSDKRGCMVLDGAALTQLELFRSQEGDVSLSLFGFLNKTCCALGERMLRRWLLKPLISASRINDRSSTVDFLCNNFSLCLSYQERLSSLPDLERCLGKLLNAAAGCYKMAVYFDECVFSKLYSLHQLLEHFLSLHSYVSSFFSEASTIEGCPSLLRDMSSSLVDVTVHCKDLLGKLQVTGPKSCSSASVGVWEGSDDVRGRISRTQSSLDEVLVGIRRHAPSASYVHTKFRYEVEMPESNYRRISGDKSWEVTSTRSGYVRVRNQRIVSLVTELEDHEFSLGQSELLFFQSSVKYIHDRRDIFGSLLVTAADLDCLCSLASVAKNAVIPLVRASVFERGDGEPYMVVRNSVHPIVCQLNPDTFVSNDVHLNHGDYRAMILLTGPNMGGKSTLLRQTALCAIMAHIGSFVPASECKMTVVDRIYTRLGASDNLIEGKSTFLVEMEEVSSMLRTGTSDSLVLVDELGRGTSTFDATAIAAACLEKISSIGCRCIFTTHFQEVCSYSLRLPNVSLCHMLASFDDTERTLTFMYKLSLGQCPESHGIHVARLAGIPAHVLELAEEVSRRFRVQKRSTAAIVKALLGAHSRGDDSMIRSLYDELFSSINIRVS
ncbi:DNA mismatch repair protein MSH6 [Babesia sp. Xinjiang]|uniref:DNA mismatch repair protein MSH6 n=1 Tax=Babesia sp. Xinjiang TaxID=462227 RepID=UPI000A242D86|nr:DNA mismatch repair protein MSH6 [Babesia sp. Xinjiang]ORM40499.1 DNA mismatch repair protein MSH6 [Babesia sp. Xinjiang]